MKHEPPLTIFQGGTSSTSINKETKEVKSLKSDEEKMAVNLCEKFSEKYRFWKIKKIADLTSKLTGVSAILLKRLSFLKYRNLSRKLTAYITQGFSVRDFPHLIKKQRFSSLHKDSSLMRKNVQGSS